MFGCSVPVGLVYSINPFMIIFMVPIVGALTTHYNHFDMIHLGGYVSALAPFWMVAFTTGVPPGCLHNALLLWDIVSDGGHTYK